LSELIDVPIAECALPEYHALIFANDVKCTHGAAIGQLDDAAMFYLRSRGLGVSESRAMLVRAFAGDILNRVKIAPVREYLEAILTARLPHVE